MEYIYLTREGLDNLKKELHELKYKTRPDVSKKVAAAREHGDLKENAEYHAAREELSMVETKVQQLQEKIVRARLIEDHHVSTDQVSIMTTVQIQDLRNNKEYQYTLVSAEETNVKENKISVISPVAQGLLGKKVGEIAEIKVPAGILKYKILSITR